MPSLSPAILADAIRSYVSEIAAELVGQDDNGAVATLESDEEVISRLTAAEPGYLTIGGRTFRLMSSGEPSATGGKLLVNLRRKAAEAIRRERDAMIAAATTQARIVRQQVEAERAAFRREQQIAAEAARLATRNVFAVPGWLNGQGVAIRQSRSIDGAIEVLQRLSYQPTRFSYPGWEVWERANGFEDPTPDDEMVRNRVCEIEWSAEQAEPIYPWIWITFMPSTGAFELNQSKIAEWSPKLPHADHGSICCQPQGLPAAIVDQASLTRVVACINRAYKEVNLSSLLVSMSDWSPEVKVSCPQGVRDWYDHWRDEGMDATNAFEFGAREVAREAAGVIWGR
jgi:hypothetical protein